MPAKASEPVSRSLGWTTSGGVVLWQLLLLLSPLSWVLAHLRSSSEHARRGSLPAARPPPPPGATAGPSGAALAPQLRRAGGMGLAGSVLLAAAVRVKVRVTVTVRTSPNPNPTPNQVLLAAAALLVAEPMLASPSLVTAVWVRGWQPGLGAIWQQLVVGAT